MIICDFRLHQYYLQKTLYVVLKNFEFNSGSFRLMILLFCVISVKKIIYLIKYNRCKTFFGLNEIKHNPKRVIQIHSTMIKT